MNMGTLGDVAEGLKLFRYDVHTGWYSDFTDHLGALDNTPRGIPNTNALVKVR